MPSTSRPTWWALFSFSFGLGAAALGFKYGDVLAAMGVAGFVAIAGWRLGRQTIDTLLDKAPAGISDEIRAIVSKVPGVVEIEKLRLRPGVCGRRERGVRP